MPRFSRSSSRRFSLTRRCRPGGWRALVRAVSLCTCLATGAQVCAAKSAAPGCSRGCCTSGCRPTQPNGPSGVASGLAGARHFDAGRVFPSPPTPPARGARSRSQHGAWLNLRSVLRLLAGRWPPLGTARGAEAIELLSKAVDDAIQCRGASGLVDVCAPFPLEIGFARLGSARLAAAKSARFGQFGFIRRAWPHAPKMLCHVHAWSSARALAGSALPCPLAKARR